MDPNKIILTPEDEVMDNVVNKLRIYMEKNALTLHGLASKIGFAYQPFWRLMTKKHSPTINSLSMIVPHFDCTISELINDNVFLDVALFNNVEAFINKNDIESKIRIYIPHTQFLPLIHKQFVAIKICLQKHNTTSDLQPFDISVFYLVNSIDIDGVFLVNYNNENILLDVFSISTKYIWTYLNGKEVKIDKSQVVPLAKFFNYLNLLDPTKSALIGVPK